jgi:phenylacetate-CoA ligase
MGETSPHYMIIVDRVGNLDTIEIQVELTSDMLSDEVKKLKTWKTGYAKILKAPLDWLPKLLLWNQKRSSEAKEKQKE